MNDGADWTRQREIEAACAGLTTLDRIEGRERIVWLAGDSERMTGRRTRERERQSPDGPRFVGLSRNHRMIDRRYHRRGGRGEIIRRTAAPVSGFLLATRRLPEPTEPAWPSPSPARSFSFRSTRVGRTRRVAAEQQRAFYFEKLAIGFSAWEISLYSEGTRNEKAGYRPIGAKRVVVVHGGHNEVLITSR